MSLNRIVVMGRLGATPELRSTASGTSVTSFALAVDRDRKDENGERKTDWLDVTAWRHQAEFVCKYATKGRSLVVEGRLQIREWTDNSNNKRRNAEIVAENIYFADSKREDSAQATGYGAAPSEPPAYGGYGEPAGSGFSEIEDDGDLPFNRG